MSQIFSAHRRKGTFNEIGINSKILKGQTEIVKTEVKQDHDQQNETKDKNKIRTSTLKTKAGVTRSKQKSGCVQLLLKG